MVIQEFYSEIYKKMMYSKEKGYKIILKKNLQSVLLVEIKGKDLFFNHNKKVNFIYLTRLSVDNLLTNIVFQEGNRGKVKLRNFFDRNNKNLWRQ